VSTLRVIAGKARGRRLLTVPGDSTRPITDRTKESLFNILGPDVEESSWLDLFGGTGSVGIEALSRGAAYVRFIDLQRQAVDTIKANLHTTGFTRQAEVLRMDAFTHLEQTPDRQFEYAYIAPPQYKQMWERALLLLDQRPAWLAPDAWVIVQIHPVEYREMALTNLSEIEQRKYGSTLLIFYETNPEQASEEASP
jgi:16S rRNA (guanine966-N2)-methyltransferase